MYYINDDDDEDDGKDEFDSLPVPHYHNDDFKIKFWWGGICYLVKKLSNKSKVSSFTWWSWKKRILNTKKGAEKFLVRSRKEWPKAMKRLNTIVYIHSTGE